MKTHSDFHLAPPAFSPDGQRLATFVEFLRADHVVTIDAAAETATVRSTIPFRAFRTGHPIFDLYPADITWLRLDGAAAASEEIDSPTEIDPYTGFPSPITKYRLVNAPVAPGPHLLEIEHRLARNLRFDNGLVRFDLEMADRHEATAYKYDREFLERYLPANLEFDRHPITLRVELVNAVEEHSLYANGECQALGTNHWLVEYPAHFNSSSVYLLLAPRQEIAALEFEVPASQPVDVTIVAPQPGESMGDYVRGVMNALPVLDRVLGPFPYRQLLVVAVGEGGMEHAAAVRSSPSNSVLFHEIAHNYFGRCVAPADGDAGWIDEAIAGWAERGFPSSDQPPLVATRMGNQSPYRRVTDPCAWDVGPGLAAHLDHLLRPRGGLTAFLRSWFAERRFASVRSRELQLDVERFGGLATGALQELFDRVVYGRVGDVQGCIEDWDD